jgi:hypothetical protein
MRSRRWLLAAGVLVIGLFSAGPASAGGSWITPDRPAYVPADIAVFRGNFSTGSYEGRMEDGPYVAYLLPRNQWIQSYTVPESAIRAGVLRITRASRHLFHARLEFTVPEVPAGFYHVQYCNDPCTVNGIGDLLGSDSIAIAATRAQARAFVLAERLRWKAEAASDARRHAEAEIDRLREALVDREDDVAGADARARELVQQLAETRRALQAERSRFPWAPVAGVLLLIVLALLVALAVIARRLRVARVDAELQAIAREHAPVVR